MARIIMVRHGETEWNRQMRVQGGRSDIPLNDTGRSQAEDAGNALVDKEFSAVYSSPMLRALETARIINTPHKLEVHIVPELAELDAGDYEGIPIADLGRRFSQIITEMGESDELPRTPGGESISDVQERAWQAINTVATRHSGETVLVVTHYFVILAVICKVLELPLVNISRFYMSNGSISSINLNGSVPRLEIFNSPATGPTA